MSRIFAAFVLGFLLGSAIVVLLVYALDRLERAWRYMKTWWPLVLCLALTSGCTPAGRVGPESRKCNLFLHNIGPFSVAPGAPGSVDFDRRLFVLEDGTVIQYGVMDQVVCRPQVTTK